MPFNFQKFIEHNPQKCSGQPVIQGTRVTVRTDLASLAEGASIDEIVMDFPTVSREAVRAVIAYTAASAEEDFLLRGCRVIKGRTSRSCKLRFLHETRFQADGDSIHLAGNFVIAINEADGLGFRPAFQHLIAPAQLQILNQHHAIAVGEHSAVSIFHHARGIGRFGFGRAFPFMTARDTFPAIGVFQDFVHLAHRTCRFAHKARIVVTIASKIQSRFDPNDAEDFNA